MKLDEFTIRPIRPEDNAAMAEIIRVVMTSYGLDRPGSAIYDEEVATMAESYKRTGAAYFVAEREGEILAGGGIAPLEGGTADICELRKMYARPEARGLGLGRRLLETCLEAARDQGYRQCYIETISEMTDARRLYERNGFTQVCRQGETGHFVCDTSYVRDL